MKEELFSHHTWTMKSQRLEDLLKGVVSVGSGGGKFSVKLTLHKSVLQQQKRYVPFWIKEGVVVTIHSSKWHSCGSPMWDQHPVKRSKWNGTKINTCNKIKCHINYIFLSISLILVQEREGTCFALPILKTTISLISFCIFNRLASLLPRISKLYL